MGWLSIALGAFFSFSLGMLWYGPVFGQTWMKLANIKKGDMKMENPGLTMSLATLSNLLTALAIERLFVWSGTPSLHAAMGIGVMALLGFSGPKLIDGVLWGRQRWGLFWFNMAYTLVTYLGIAGIVFALATD